MNSPTVCSEPAQDNESNVIFAKRSRCEPNVDDGLFNVSKAQETTPTMVNLSIYTYLLYLFYV